MKHNFAKAMIVLSVVSMLTACADRISKFGPYDLMSKEDDSEMLFGSLQQLRSKFGTEERKGQISMTGPIARFTLSAGGSTTYYETYDFKTDLATEGNLRAIVNANKDEVVVLQLMKPTDIKSLDALRAKWGDPQKEGRLNSRGLYRAYDFTKGNKKLHAYAFTWTEGGTMIDEIIWSGRENPWMSIDL